MSSIVASVVNMLIDTAAAAITTLSPSTTVTTTTTTIDTTINGEVEVESKKKKKNKKKKKTNKSKKSSSSPAVGTTNVNVSTTSDIDIDIDIANKENVAITGAGGIDPPPPLPPHHHHVNVIGKNETNHNNDEIVANTTTTTVVSSSSPSSTTNCLKKKKKKKKNSSTNVNSNVNNNNKENKENNNNVIDSGIGSDGGNGGESHIEFNIKKTEHHHVTATITKTIAANTIEAASSPFSIPEPISRIKSKMMKNKKKKSKNKIKWNNNTGKSSNNKKSSNVSLMTNTGDHDQQVVVIVNVDDVNDNSLQKQENNVVAEVSSTINNDTNTNDHTDEVIDANNVDEGHEDDAASAGNNNDINTNDHTDEVIDANNVDEGHEDDATSAGNNNDINTNTNDTSSTLIFQLSKNKKQNRSNHHHRHQYTNNKTLSSSSLRRGQYHLQQQRYQQRPQRPLPNFINDLPPIPFIIQKFNAIHYIRIITSIDHYRCLKANYNEEDVVKHLHQNELFCGQYDQLLLNNNDNDGGGNGSNNNNDSSTTLQLPLHYLSVDHLKLYYIPLFCLNTWASIIREKFDKNCSSLLSPETQVPVKMLVKNYKRISDDCVQLNLEDATRNNGTNRLLSGYLMILDFATDDDNNGESKDTSTATTTNTATKSNQTEVLAYFEPTYRQASSDWWRKEYTEPPRMLMKNGDNHDPMMSMIEQTYQAANEAVVAVRQRRRDCNNGGGNDGGNRNRKPFDDDASTDKDDQQQQQQPSPPPQQHQSSPTKTTTATLEDNITTITPIPPNTTPTAGGDGDGDDESPPPLPQQRIQPFRYCATLPFRQTLPLHSLIGSHIIARPLYYLLPCIRNIQALQAMNLMEKSADCGEYAYGSGEWHTAKHSFVSMLLDPMYNVTSAEAVDGSLDSATLGVVVNSATLWRAHTFNKQQCRAIVKCCRAVLYHRSLPRLVMVQGPPGTGKTHTLIGLIGNLFLLNNGDGDDGNGNRYRRKPFRLLIAAPSNGAIDEIAKRLLEVQPELEYKLGHSLHIVRLGQSAEMAPEVIPIALRSIVNAAMDRFESLGAAGDDDNNNDDDGVGGGFFGRGRGRGHRGRTGGGGRPFSMIQTKLLDQAHIVLTTLNSSYLYTSTVVFDAAILDEASQSTEAETFMPLVGGVTRKVLLFGDHKQLPATVMSQVANDNGFGRSLFERFFSIHELLLQERQMMMMMKKVVVVDNDVVDIGDDDENHFVITLNTQYRMNEDICKFPSYHFYSGMLYTNPGTGIPARQLCYSPPPRRSITDDGSSLSLSSSSLQGIEPLLLFDVQHGEEQQRPTVSSRFNSVEVGFICNLIVMLLERFAGIPASWLAAAVGAASSADDNDNNETVVIDSLPFSIGVITFYSAQKEEIIAAFQTYYPCLEHLIQVGTVDSFQGQEKDIIILSCVRALVKPTITEAALDGNDEDKCNTIDPFQLIRSKVDDLIPSDSKCVGFVRSQQRLNVAITRAKFANYIVMQVDTFVVVESWRQMITDMKCRGLYRKVKRMNCGGDDGDGDGGILDNIVCDDLRQWIAGGGGDDGNGNGNGNGNENDGIGDSSSSI